LAFVCAKFQQLQEIDLAKTLFVVAEKWEAVKNKKASAFAEAFHFSACIACSDYAITFCIS
jgi:hypothetical protein